MSPHDPLEGERKLDNAPQPVPPSVDRLPPYLGLCWLEPSSVRAADGRVSAIYSHADGLSYRIDWSSDGCQIAEFEGERRLWLAGGPSLEPVALQLAAAQLDGDGSRFWERVAKRLMGRAYVHRDLSDDVTMAFFPAFALGCVRVVLPDDMRRQVADPDRIESTDSVGTPRIAEWAASPGAIVRRWADGSTTTERVTLIDHIAPAIWLEELVVEPWEWGRQGRTREERIVAGPLSLALAPGLCYVGDPARSLDSYAVVKAFTESPLEQGTDEAEGVLARWRP